MNKLKLFWILFFSLSGFACRSTSGELKRELYVGATSVEAFAEQADVHQTRLNTLLINQPVEAVDLLDSYRQATLYLKKETSQIRPVTIGGKSGILQCRFDPDYCFIVSTQEQLAELTAEPIRRTILQALETGSQKNALEIGRALAKVDSNFIRSISQDTIPNKKNAAAMCLGLSQKNEELCQDFLSRAAAAYPQLEFAQDIDRMDGKEVKAASAKLGRISVKNDIVLAKYVGILKLAVKDRLKETAIAEQEERRCNGYAGMPADDFLPIQCIIRECESSARLGLKVYTACMERCNARADKWVSCNKDD